MSRATLGDVLATLTAAGYAPRTVVAPQGRARRVEFGTGVDGQAHGVFFVGLRTGAVLSGLVDYGDRAAPGTPPWQFTGSHAAYWSVCDLPRLIPYTTRAAIMFGAREGVPTP